MMLNDSSATSSQTDVVRVNEHGPSYQHQGSSKSSGGMSGNETNRQEAYYLFFMGALGISLNVLVIVTILLRRTLRKMTSAFLIHACFLNLLKSAYCIPFGVNLLGDLPPSDCSFEGISYVVIITTSSFNMVAMICAEAYTFGENNVGGKSRGSCCCVAFGIFMVYISSLVLHLGPTLIGGYFDYNPEIGNCSFSLGKVTGYIANVMWISIVTLSLVAVGHFICKMYKEIQRNQPNRVSMLVRSSITIMDDADTKISSTSLRAMVKEASHRAKIFVITVAAYVLSWYPLFLLIIFDMHFRVSPKVYQAFSFIAWSQGTVEPLIYICFDRQLNLLSRWVYCDRYNHYDAETLHYLMSQNRGNVPGNELEEGGGGAGGGGSGPLIHPNHHQHPHHLHHQGGAGVMPGGGGGGAPPPAVYNVNSIGGHHPHPHHQHPNNQGGGGGGGSYRSGAAIPYHDDDDIDDHDASQGSPSPPPLSSSNNHHNLNNKHGGSSSLTAAGGMLMGGEMGGPGGGGVAAAVVEEPTYGNQQQRPRGAYGSKAGAGHPQEVEAKLEPRVPKEVTC